MCLADDFDSIRDVYARRTTSSDADVRVYEADLGAITRRGYTTCLANSETGEEGTKNMWRRPQVMYLNNYYEQTEWNVDGAVRKWLACHESGHTLGLRHADAGNHENQWMNSCMRTWARTEAP